MWDPATSQNFYTFFKGILGPWAVLKHMKSEIFTNQKINKTVAQTSLKLFWGLINSPEDLQKIICKYSHTAWPLVKAALFIHVNGKWKTELHNSYINLCLQCASVGFMMWGHKKNPHSSFFILSASDLKHWKVKQNTLLIYFVLSVCLFLSIAVAPKFWSIYRHRFYSR